MDNQNDADLKEKLNEAVNAIQSAVSAALDSVVTPEITETLKQGMGLKLSGGCFALALSCLKQGRKVSRSGWNGKGMWLKLVTDWSVAIGEELPEAWIAQPFIAMKTVDGSVVPWLASQSDLLAEDWVCVDQDQ